MPGITVTVRSTVGSTIGLKDGTAQSGPEPSGQLGGWPVGQGSVRDCSVRTVGWVVPGRTGEVVASYAPARGCL